MSEKTPEPATSDAPRPAPKPGRLDLPEDVVAPIGVGIVAILGALAAVAAPFVPSVGWYTGDALFPSTRNELTFAEAAWMIASHRIEHHEGVFLFVLPSLFALAALGLRSQIGAKRVWHALSLASVVIAMIELVLVFVDATYGSTYYAVAGFLGIQSMIPEDEFTMHAAMLFGASVTWAIGEELRLRRAVSGSSG